MKKATFLAALTAAMAAQAYLPPVDVKDGVEVRIGTFDQAIDRNPRVLQRKLGVVDVDGTKPRPFPVTVTNLTDRAVTGELKVWINDDWTVSGPSGQVSVPAKSGVTLDFVGTPLDRSLAALYPVHATFRAEGMSEPAHPIAIFMARKPFAQTATAPVLKRGSCLLNDRFRRRVRFEVAGKVRDVPEDKPEVLQEWGGHFTRLVQVSAKEVVKRGFSSHPPYRKGAGVIWCDYPLYLPQESPITFSFANMVTSDKSDGVENKVFVLEDGQAPKELYSSVVTGKDGWKEGRVDLTPWAGKRIGLRLWTGPGPKMNTAFDGGAWGDPVLSVGPLQSRPDEATWQARERAAVAAARQALQSGTDPAKGAYLLSADGQRFGAGVVEGARSLIDGAIAFTDGTNDLVYRGFACEVDDLDMSGAASPVALKASVSVAPEGALKISWSMPGAVRAKDGTPRYTRLALGPGSEPAWRAYMGFGNVYEEPRRFRLTSGGFTLSTRHVGADYRNGLSLVQATDVIADACACDAARKVFSLEAHHDATFTFIPSRRGAYEAARRFWKICGYRPSPGHDRLAGRLCLDQWGGDYAKAAADIRLAAKYGLGDSFFVKHVWQRWGYDYRLPEIYPPAGDVAAFGDMAKACKESGIFFCPHDNYTDIYPDADRYSYDLVVFNLDGTPQRAWFNHGRLALSYRWAPHAFRPWCLRNAKLLKEGYDPEGVFIDVLTAHGPFDYLDRSGAFHSKQETSRHWADAFQAYREGYRRPDAITVSEAGQDHLVGTLDAGESDHFPAVKLVSRTAFRDAERTPWHDMATHNRFILLAGGLGGRYQEEQWHKGGDAELHGYASDDYLNNTVMGGRNPMSDGPFGRHAVLTYWMLHDACASLAKAEFVSHEFGDDIHCQHTRFSTGADVWSNRRTNGVWTVAGVTLPPYGFLVKIPNGPECGVVLKDGQRVGYAKAKDVTFVDGRLPRSGVCGPQAKSAAVSAKVTGPDTATIETEWEVLENLGKYRVFCHIDRETEERHGDNIAFQAGVRFDDKAVLTKTGKCRGTIDLRFPASLEEGEYSVRYGLWDPKHGGRAVIEGENDGSRIIAGYFKLAKRDGKVASLTWRAAGELTELRQARNRLLGRNDKGRSVDFGGIVTPGAVKFDHPASGDWRVTALPRSKEFPVEIDLAAFGAANRRVTAVEPVDAGDKKAAWRQDGAKLSFVFPAETFAYRIRFAD